MLKQCGALAVASGLALGSTALGQNWAEQGDAGDLPATAQVIEGSGALTSITGTHLTDDVDMYKIKIVNAGGFSASTVGGTTWDTQLFLFHLDGRGVVHNDDHVGGTTLQSTLTSQFIPASGEYYLAISRYDRDCRDAGNSLLWNSTPFRAERIPDGPGAANAIASWANATTGGGAYRIDLTGCEFVGEECYPDCDTSTGPGNLDIFDFLCFQNRYDAGSAYACDCDLSTGPGNCDIFDFLCFQNAYDQGCP